MELSPSHPRFPTGSSTSGLFSRSGRQVPRKNYSNHPRTSTDAIKQSIQEGDWDDTSPDVLIMEIGGTVGDIEGEPYLETARQMRHAMGEPRALRPRCLAAVPEDDEGIEDQTRSSLSPRVATVAGIHPDIIIARADESIRKTTSRSSHSSAVGPWRPSFQRKPRAASMTCLWIWRNTGLRKQFSPTLGLEPRRPALKARQLVRKSRNGKPTLDCARG